MGTKLFFNPNIIPGAPIWLGKNGKNLIPYHTGRIDPLKQRDKLKMFVYPLGFEVFLIDPNDYTKRIPLTPSSDGLIEINMNHSISNGVGLMAKWPNNLIVLENQDNHYSLGIASQKGILSFVIEKAEDDETTEPGVVKWFSPLRGYGAISSGDPFLDYRIHWTALPKRANGFRYVETGEKVQWQQNNVESIASKNGSTFFKEIKRVTIVT